MPPSPVPATSRVNLPLSVSLHELDVCPDGLLATAADWLAADQRARAERFVTATLRRRFLAAQAALRLHLAARVQAAPGSLVLQRDAHGKPMLEGPTPLHFNLSHSGAWAVVASAGMPLGVDLEALIPEPRHDVAAAFLDADALHAWRSLPRDRRSAALTEGWCAREAVLKLDGRGLALDPRLLRMPAQLPGWAEWDGPLGRGYVQTLSAPPGFHACLASAEALSVDPSAAPFSPW